MSVAVQKGTDLLLKMSLSRHEMKALLLFFVTFLFLQGCVFPAGPGSEFTGTYRMGADPSNSSYLLLSESGRYQEINSSTSEALVTVKRFHVLKDRGRWVRRFGRIELLSEIKAQRRVLEVGSDGKLFEQFGAGYKPSFGYAKIHPDVPIEIRDSPVFMGGGASVRLSDIP